MRIYTSTLVLLVSIYFAKAQPYTIESNPYFSNKLEKASLLDNNPYFSSTQPFIKTDFKFNTDSILCNFQKDTKLITYLKHPILWKKLRSEDLIRYRNNDFSISADPILYFSKSSYSTSPFLSRNTRGFNIKGAIKNNFAFGTGFSENQAFFPEYISKYTYNRGVAPGYGRRKIFKKTGYDFSEAYGYISYNPIKQVNLQMGHGKQFVGNGYRSLVQSYNTANIPYLKLTTHIDKLRYSNIFQLFQGAYIIADGTSEIESRRYNSTHILSYLIGKNFEISLIESVIFAPKRKKNYFPNINLFNPIIGYRSIQYKPESEQNTLSGINLKLDILHSIRLYSQFVYNGRKKYAFQFGAKSYHMFNLPIKTQIEYNKVKPYTYSHHSTQSFTNANQELAHPIGAGFREIVGKIGYQWSDFYLNCQINLIQAGKGALYPLTGFNTEKTSTYEDLKGVTELTHLSLDFSYMINPVYNLSLFFNYRQRILKPKTNPQKELFYSFGLRTYLHPIYKDF